MLTFSQRLRTCSLPDLRMLFKTVTPGHIQTPAEEQGEVDEDEHDDEEENADEEEDLEGDEEVDRGNGELDDDDDYDDDDDDDGDDDDDKDDNEGDDDDDDVEEELNVGRFVHMKRKCISMHLQGFQNNFSSLNVPFFFKEREVTNILFIARFLMTSTLYFENIILGCMISPIGFLNVA